VPANPGNGHGVLAVACRQGDNTVLLDARSIDNGSALRSDVCIIGAGPAGITLAKELIGSGLSVLLLESGGAKPDKVTQALAGGESVGHSYFALGDTRMRGFGGTSNHWYRTPGFRSRPLEELDFEERPGIRWSGWPFKRPELEPYYERALALVGASPLGYDLETWEDRANRPRLPIGDLEVTSPVFQLGGTEMFRERFDELAGANNIRLCLHANVLEICTGQAGDTADRVHHLRVGTLERRTFTASARVYVLAAGGIENPRLLLLSRGTSPSGLGNRHDLVGRFFMEHLAVRSGDFRPLDHSLLEKTRLYRAHTVDGVRVQAKLAVRPDVLRREQLLNSTFFFERMSEARASQAVASFVVLRRALTYRPRPPHLFQHATKVVSGLDDIVTTASRVLRRRSHASEVLYQLKAMSEQAPNPDSRVTLSSRLDALGLPRARLDWRLTELDTRSIRRALDIIDGQLQVGGLGRLERKLGEEDPPAHIQGQWHHMGTTRMHHDPRLGVVDANCRMHDVSNLFVAGSSVFPTGGYANPTLTILALTLRLADHLRARFDNLDLP
jgi:choline dehydrogenase-like flavoprotein